MIFIFEKYSKFVFFLIFSLGISCLSDEKLTDIKITNQISQNINIDIYIECEDIISTVFKKQLKSLEESPRLLINCEGHKIPSEFITNIRVFDINNSEILNIDNKEIDNISEYIGKDENDIIDVDIYKVLIKN
ncbi:MAG: hypothetical protein OEZ22_15185 [Spirochaetia bacterium]|nr:hypothetical protein [Spirochaetia bacterium]